MSAFEGFFALQVPKDLLQKLERDFERLRQYPTSTDAAFCFFVTAEHLVDWLHPDAKEKNKGEARAEREKLRNSSVVLEVCSHLANGAKHFKAMAKHHDKVRGTTIEEGAFQRDAFQANAFQVDELVVELDGEALRQLGGSIEVVKLAERVLDFWKKHPNLQ